MRCRRFFTAAIKVSINSLLKNGFDGLSPSVYVLNTASLREPCRESKEG
jgi:hypothetical protein